MTHPIDYQAQEVHFNQVILSGRITWVSDLRQYGDIFFRSFILLSRRVNAKNQYEEQSNKLTVWELTDNLDRQLKVASKIQVVGQLKPFWLPQRERNAALTALKAMNGNVDWGFALNCMKEISVHASQPGAVTLLEPPNSKFIEIESLMAQTGHQEQSEMMDYIRQAIAQVQANVPSADVPGPVTD